MPIVLVAVSSALAFLVAWALIGFLKARGASDRFCRVACAVYAFVLHPFAFLVLLGLFMRPGDIGFVVGPVTGIGLLGGLIGASVAVLRRLKS